MACTLIYPLTDFSCKFTDLDDYTVLSDAEGQLELDSMFADGNMEMNKEIEPLSDISNKENVQPTPVAKDEPPAKRKKVDQGKKEKGKRIKRKEKRIKRIKKRRR